LALHPPVAVVRAVLDLQDDPEQGGIGRGDVLTLPEMTAGLRIERVESNTVDDGLEVMLDPADADRLPMSAPDLAPCDLDVGIGA
jgi:hypothetical protein